MIDRCLGHISAAVYTCTSYRPKPTPVPFNLTDGPGPADCLATCGRVLRSFTTINRLTDEQGPGGVRRRCPTSLRSTLISLNSSSLLTGRNVRPVSGQTFTSTPLRGFPVRRNLNIVTESLEQPAPMRTFRGRIRFRTVIFKAIKMSHSTLVGCHEPSLRRGGPRHQLCCRDAPAAGLTVGHVLIEYQ